MHGDAFTMSGSANVLHSSYPCMSQARRVPAVLPQTCSIVTSCSINCVSLYHRSHPNCCCCPPPTIRQATLSLVSQHAALSAAPAGHLRLRVHAAAYSGSEAGAVWSECQCAAAGPLDILGPTAVLAALCSQPGPPAPTRLAPCQSVPLSFCLSVPLKHVHKPEHGVWCCLPLGASSLDTTHLLIAPCSPHLQDATTPIS